MGNETHFIAQVAVTAAPNVQVGRHYNITYFTVEVQNDRVCFSNCLASVDKGKGCTKIVFVFGPFTAVAAK